MGVVNSNKILTVLLFVFATAGLASEPSVETFPPLSRAGYFLGSFDPIHRGHFAMATQALDHKHVDFVVIYALPVDGKRKASKPQAYRNEIIRLSLQELLASHPEYCGKIFYLDAELGAARDMLGRANQRYSWIALIGSDNPVLVKESLHAKYMVRNEYAGVKGVPFDHLASSAITASEFLVFRRTETQAIPKNMAGRPVIVHDMDARFNGDGATGYSSTKIRNFIKANDFASAGQMVWLRDSDLHLLSEYAN